MLPHGESACADEGQLYHVVTVEVSVTPTTAAVSFHGSSSIEINLTS